MDDRSELLTVHLSAQLILIYLDASTTEHYWRLHAVKLAARTSSAKFEAEGCEHRIRDRSLTYMKVQATIKFVFRVSDIN